MSSKVGALLLPVPPPAFGPVLPNDPAVAPIQDPALDVLAQFFRAMLEHYCGDAWNSVAPGEPLVRMLSVGHDPEELDFHDGMTPLLALWRDGEGIPVRLADGAVQSGTQIHVLWVGAPADEQKLAARSPFFLAFTAAMKTAFRQERDPCWVRPEDVNSDTARAYGSYVWGLAGIDGWNYGGTRRMPVVVPTAGEPQRFTGYLATWTILESTETDPALWGSTIAGTRVGVTPTEIYFEETDQPRDPLVADPAVLTRQSALIPADDP